MSDESEFAEQTAEQLHESEFAEQTAEQLGTPGSNFQSPPRPVLVQYQVKEGEFRPALVTRANDDGRLNLQVFLDGENDFDLGHTSPLYVPNVGEGERVGEYTL